jgi:hypothetical protein
MGMEVERCINNTGKKQMSASKYDKRLHNYGFLRKRALAFVRHKAQCAYRNEEFLLTLEDWIKFWPDEKTFARRGRAIEDLMMTRFDWEGPWSRENCCIVTRHAHFNISNKRRVGKPYEQFFKGAITIA